MKLLRRWKLKKQGLKTAVKRKTDEKHPLVHAFDSGILARDLTALILIGLLILLMVAGGYYTQRKLSQGQSVNEDIRSSIDFRYWDDEATQRLREQEANKIQEIFRLDLPNIKLTIDDVRDEISGVIDSDTQLTTEM